MKAFCLNPISKVALATLKNPDTIVQDVETADSILVRSYAMHDYALSKNILAVARAGAGVNNIPLDTYAEQGVVVFNTPGANANAVKELVVCALLLGSRDIFGGADWVRAHAEQEDLAKACEKAKSQFAGNEIYGKKIAVLGLGKIGILVANACDKLGMKVIGYDPYLQVAGAMKLDRDIRYVESLEEAIGDADFITIHIPANDKTHHMLNASSFEKMKKGVCILNFSRDLLVDEEALQSYMESGKVRKYITDFANPTVVKLPNTIVLPHLGASTEEAEDQCAMMAIDELKDYLENGNITNSVNYPALSAGPLCGTKRICINHHNVPGMIAQFTTVLSEQGANILNLVNKSKGEYAYTIIDVEQDCDLTSIQAIDSVLRVREIG